MENCNSTNSKNCLITPWWLNLPMKILTIKFSLKERSAPATRSILLKFRDTNRQIKESITCKTSTIRTISLKANIRPLPDLRSSCPNSWSITPLLLNLFWTKMCWDFSIISNKLFMKKDKLKVLKNNYPRDPISTSMMLLESLTANAKDKSTFSNFLIPWEI